MDAGASSWKRIRGSFTSSRLIAHGHARSTRGLRSARGLVLPDFLGIGAQKAGTTWLGANLQCHPDLFVSQPRELHFFDEHFSDGLAEYSRHFSAAAGRVKGEITPAYSLLSVDRVEFIHRVMPEVRLVFVMRNPIDRAWSQARMEVVYNTGRSIEEVGEDELLRHLASKPNLRRGNYVRALDTWLSVFPLEQLFVGFFEDLRERPRDLLGSIFEFLGVTTAVDWSCFPHETVVRPGSRERRAGAPPPIPEECRRFLRESYASQLAELHVRYGPRVAGWK